MTERIYRASSLGYSMEALVAPHLGFEAVAPPEFLQNAYDEGNRLEPIVLDYLRGIGWEIGDEQLEVGLDIIPDKVKVVGHLDGIGRCATTTIPQSVVEIKTMSGKSFTDWVNKGWNSSSPLIEKYKWQQSAYVLATGLPHAMVGWDKDSSESDPRTMTHLTTEPFYTISDIAAKLAQAEEFIEKGLVPDGCNDWPCPWYYLHPPKDEVAKVDDDELEELLQSWLSYDMIEKNAKKVKDEYRASILALTGDALAAKVKGECGVTVETYWQEEKEYTVKKKEGWITRISGPRKGKNGS